VWLAACKVHAGCTQKKVAFESWSFCDGYHAIVAAPAEMAEGAPFPLYAGYRSDGGQTVHEGPLPATYTYRVTSEQGEWGDLTTKSAEEAVYGLTAWSDGNYAGEWNRKAEGKQMILSDGKNPPVAKHVWYKFDYNTRRIMTDHEHTQDQDTQTPIQSSSASPRVWKAEQYVPVPPKDTAPGTLRCMPRSAGSYLYKIVMCVSTNVSGTNTLAWAHRYDLPKD